jgi:hypothetical protein
MTQCVCGCKQEVGQGEEYFGGHKHRYPWMTFIGLYGYTNRALFFNEMLARYGSIEKMASALNLNVTTLKKGMRAEGIKCKRGPKQGEDRIGVLTRPPGWKRRCNKCGGDPFPNFFNCPSCLTEMGNNNVPIDFETCYGSPVGLMGLYFGGI